MPRSWPPLKTYWTFIIDAVERVEMDPEHAALNELLK
jgi:hypothetical protein